MFWPSPYLLRCLRLPDNDVLCIFAREHFPIHLSTSAPLCTFCQPGREAREDCGVRLLVSWRRGPWWEMTLNLFPIVLPGRSHMINTPLPSDRDVFFSHFEGALLRHMWPLTCWVSDNLLRSRLAESPLVGHETRFSPNSPKTVCLYADIFAWFTIHPTGENLSDTITLCALSCFKCNSWKIQRHAGTSQVTSLHQVELW